MPELEDQGSASESQVVNDTEVISDATPSRPELEAKVASNLAEVFKDDDTSAEEVSPAGEKPATDETVEAPADKKEPEAAATTEEAAKEDSPVVGQTQAPTLPAAYVRSLKALDWSDAEIAEAAKQPALLPSIAKLHDSRNKEIQAWADLGRKNREQQQQPSQSQTAQSQQQDTGLKPVDVATLKKQYGEDRLIDEIAGPVNRAIEQINKLMPVIQQNQRTSQQAAMETLGRQIEQFFGSKELEPLKDVYGSLAVGLNEKQVTARNKVLEQADALVAGARIQGRQLSLDEALSFAFDSVSSGAKEQAVRSTIQKQMKTREKGITLRPGSRGSATTGAVTSRRDLERKTAKGLASVFGRS